MKTAREYYDAYREVFRVNGEVSLSRGAEEGLVAAFATAQADAQRTAIEQAADKLYALSRRHLSVSGGEYVDDMGPTLEFAAEEVRALLDTATTKETT